MTRDDFAENGQWIPVSYSTDEERYGSGINLTVYEDTERWPQLTLMRLHSMDSIPDTTIFVLEHDIEEPEASAFLVQSSIFTLLFISPGDVL